MHDEHENEFTLIGDRYVKAVVHTDDFDYNPRKEYDNVGIMFCKHGRYNLGDKDAEDPIEEYDVWELDGYVMDEDHWEAALDGLRDQLRWEKAWVMHGGEEDGDRPADKLEETINTVRYHCEETTECRVREDVAIILPLYLYDHGGITISHGRFSCPWDSGQVGLHYMTKEAVQREWDGDLEKAKKYMEGELETYDHYLRGNVWGFYIETEDGEYLDSCGGFFGDEIEETGMLEAVEEKYVDLLKDAWERRFDAR